MSSTSNQLSPSSRLLANKPMNEEVNEQGENFKTNGNTTFEMNYGRWLEEHHRLISEIRSALNDHNYHIIDDKLRLLIDIVMKHYFEQLEMKTSAAKVDVFNIGSASWCRTAERDLWFIGGFRPSELLQVILPQVQHLCSQQQLLDILNFRQSCVQAEDAFAQGMEKLHEIHAKATAAGDNGFEVTCVSQLVSFLKQADHLRQEFLHQFSRLLTISQQTQFKLALGERLHNLMLWSSL